jgi:hypothetical protein
MSAARTWSGERESAWFTGSHGTGSGLTGNGPTVVGTSGRPDTT